LNVNYWLTAFYFPVKKTLKKGKKDLENWVGFTYLCTRFGRFADGMGGRKKVFEKSFEKFGGNKKAITFAAPNRRKRVQKGMQEDGLRP
jgi:hypothetical protein